MNTEQAVFGGGCFWCLEAVFLRVPGVLEVTSGYAGGSLPHPTYDQVCTGATGHAEVVKILFDSEKTSFVDLLEIFWKCHDPTTLNRQGYDQGTQYRSIILPENEIQNRQALESRSRFQTQCPKPVVTEIKLLDVFWPAEVQHHDFYNRNPEYGYCQGIIAPKLKKLGLTVKPWHPGD